MEILECVLMRFVLPIICTIIALFVYNGPLVGWRFKRNINVKKILGYSKKYDHFVYQFSSPYVGCDLWTLYGAYESGEKKRKTEEIKDMINCGPLLDDMVRYGLLFADGGDNSSIIYRFNEKDVKNEES